MKMVTYYNKTDMIGFANHISQLIKDGKKQPEPNGNLRVTHAEFEAWKDSHTKH